MAASRPSTTLSLAERRSLWATAAVLALLLWLRLLPALYGALASFALYMSLSGAASVAQPQRQRRIASALLAAGLLLATLVAAVQSLEVLLGSGSGNLAQLLSLMADALDRVRSSAPPWLAERLPDSALALQHALSNWLRTHAGQMQHWGHEALRIIVQLILGTAIGLLAAGAVRARGQPLLTRLIADRWLQLAGAFSDVFAAQVRIALVNSLLTALYLVVALPLLGFRVPLGFTLVAFSFFASLLPIVGNLLSNTAIILATLTVSPWLAVASLAFLVIVHKLEYFLNAHFVGSRIELPTYALLTAMLVLEAAFGVAGLVAAPVFAAWLTRELRAGGWI